MKRKYILFTTLSILLLAICYIGISLVCANQLTKTIRKPLTETPVKYRIPFKTITFPSKIDQLRIAGWFLDYPSSNKIIVLLHGKDYHRANPEIGLLELTRDLYLAGYDVLAFDWRGYGESEGKRFSLGYYESRDLLGAIDYLHHKGYQRKDITILAWSMGAATALITQAKSDCANALILNSCYSDLPQLLKQEIPRRTHLPQIFVPGVILAVKLMYGADANTIRPYRSVANLRDCPVLLIHGSADTTVPVSNANQIWKQLPTNPRNMLWIVPGGTHVDAYKRNPLLYLQQINRFIAEQ